MDHRPARANPSIVYCSFPRRDTSQAKASSRQAENICLLREGVEVCSTSDNVSKFQQKSLSFDALRKDKIGGMEEWEGGRFPSRHLQPSGAKDLTLNRYIRICWIWQSSRSGRGPGALWSLSKCKIHS